MKRPKSRPGFYPLSFIWRTWLPWNSFRVLWSYWPTFSSVAFFLWEINCPIRSFARLCVLFASSQHLFLSWLAPLLLTLFQCQRALSQFLKFLQSHRHLRQPAMTMTVSHLACRHPIRYLVIHLSCRLVVCLVCHCALIKNCIDHFGQKRFYWS